MNKELTCAQVSSLIHFYIEGKLNSRLKEYIDLHIAKCPACRKKVDELKNILENFNVIQVENTHDEPFYKSYPELVRRLSAYVDNELDIDENIRIKKIAISNPSARRELETIYKYQKLLQSAYAKTKNNTKVDFSKIILNKIQRNEDYTTDYFYRISIIFVILLSAIIGGFIYLYF